MIRFAGASLRDRTLRAGLLAFVAMLACVEWGRAQEASQPADATDEESGSFTPNLASPTLGGKQWWSDELVFYGWRIQRNVLTKHCRLLDDKNVRRAWGTFRTCHTQLESLRREHQLPQLPKRVVVVLHGLGRSRQSVAELCDYLRENGDFTVLNVSYASTRRSLREHADSLSKVIENLEGVRHVDFVAHSMGNLVIRRFLAERRKTDPDRQLTPRAHRFVMLAPPNNGAQLAERFQKNPVFQTLWGTSGMELAEGWEALESELATPSCQFGIIAGGAGHDSGLNPLLDGDDDLVVSVAETRLGGAHDFVVLPVLHTGIMDDPTVREYTLRFLREGHFISEDRRCPLASD